MREPPGPYRDCEAVIENRSKELHERLQAWDNNTSVRERLNAFLHYELEQAEVTARCGCPIGGLCQELAKQGGLLADAAAKLLNDIIEWSEKQFKGLGFGEKSSEYALQFVSAIQGMALLTNTFKDPKLTLQLNRTIEVWLDKLSATSGASISVVQESAIA